VDAKWIRLWFALFVVIVFLVGLGTGVVIDRRFGGSAPPVLFGRGQGRGLGPGPGAGMRGMQAPMLVDRLTADLKLDAGQRTRVEKILAARRTRMEEFNRDVRTRFESEQRDLRAEIRGVLKPDQQTQFDEWLKRNPLGAGPPGRRGGGPAGRQGPPGRPF
jgi:hypothetical protein